MAVLAGMRSGRSLGGLGPPAVHERQPASRLDLGEAGLVVVHLVRASPRVVRLVEWFVAPESGTLGVEPEGERTVVHELDRHLRAEGAGLDIGNAGGAELVGEATVEAVGELRRAALVKPGRRPRRCRRRA